MSHRLNGQPPHEYEMENEERASDETIYLSSAFPSFPDDLWELLLPEVQNILKNQSIAVGTEVANIQIAQSGEILQEEYTNGINRNNRLRIDYGPRGCRLDKALADDFSEITDSDEVMFADRKIGQKMSFWYQIKGDWPKHNRQVNVLNVSGKPTKGRLAKLCAQEFKSFIDACPKDKPFPLLMSQIALYHIDITSKASLQPKIGLLRDDGGVVVLEELIVLLALGLLTCPSLDTSSSTI